ncbi:MAG TPA: TolC family protein [Pseudohongiella sp.]|nr:TolC family protein [Pseudohongiella sp.]
MSNSLKTVVRSVTLASAMVLLSACAGTYVETKQYEREQLVSSVPGQFSELSISSDAGVRLSESQPVTEWWKTLNDAQLVSLIDRAMLHNHDVQLAMQNLALARLGEEAERLAWRPRTSVALDGSRQRQPDLSAMMLPDNPYDRWNSGLDVSWEADVFGRIRQAVNAAEAEVAASQAELEGVYLSLAAEVAANYVQLRGLQQQRNVSQRNADNLQQSYELTVELRDAGLGDGLDVERAQSRLNLVLSALPALDAEIARTIRRIGVLTGQAPHALVDELSTVRELPSIPAVINVGDPAGMIRRRPDIRSAEYQLSAALSRYQLSVTELYPRISISGSLGFVATRLADLGTAGTFTYLLGPGIRWDAFDMGRVQNRIDISDVQVQSQLVRFEQTLLRSLEDIDNAMSALSHETDRHQRLREAAEASARATQLAMVRYEVGSDSFLDVLDAQRTQLEAENLLVQSEADLALNVIRVYKALGGGW